MKKQMLDIFQDYNLSSLSSFVDRWFEIQEAKAEKGELFVEYVEDVLYDIERVLSNKKSRFIIQLLDECKLLNVHSIERICSLTIGDVLVYGDLYTKRAVLFNEYFCQFHLNFMSGMNDAMIYEERVPSGAKYVNYSDFLNDRNDLVQIETKDGRGAIFGRDAINRLMAF